MVLAPYASCNLIALRLCAQALSGTSYCARKALTVHQRVVSGTQRISIQEFCPWSIRWSVWLQAQTFGQQTFVERLEHSYRPNEALCPYSYNKGVSVTG